MRLIDADAAIKDARANYGGVHDAVLMEHFLNTQPTITPPPNSPLTLEELREMDGDPVWLEIAGGVWGLVDTDDNVVWLDRGGSIDLAKIVGLAYRRKPEKGEEHGKQV